MKIERRIEETQTINGKNIGKALTWNELADLYPGTAKIEPMDKVFDSFAKQTDKYYICSDKGTIHKIIKEKDNAKKE